MSLDIEDFVGLAAKAIDNREEAKAWDMWLTRYPYMTQENYIPFNQFYQKQSQPISNRSDEEILKESLEIRRRAKMRKEVM